MNQKYKEGDSVWVELKESSWQSYIGPAKVLWVDVDTATFEKKKWYICKLPFGLQNKLSKDSKKSEIPFSENEIKYKIS